MSSTPIPVLLYTHTDSRGGAEEHILQLLNGFDRSLFRPHLACTPQLAELMRPDVPADVEVFPLRLDGFADFGGARKLAHVLRQRRIQILHSHQFRASFFASPVGKWCGVPVILETSHGRELWRKGWLKSRFIWDRFSARLVDRIIAVSGATARYLVEQKGIPQEKIVVICSAVDLGQFDPAWPAPEELKASLGFRDSDPVLLVAGRLEPQKGHRVLLEAMPAVLQEFPNARLVCLSDGSLLNDLKEMATRKGLSDCVRFVGRQPDVRDWLAIADLSVLPSFYEGLPLAPIESLAAGRPIVATAVDGTPEVVIDGKTGLTVPPGNPKRLAEAIRRMLRDRTWALETARAGRQHVLQNFSIEKLVRLTQELYLETWAQKTQKAPSGVPARAESPEPAGEQGTKLNRLNRPGIGRTGEATGRN